MNELSQFAEAYISLITKGMYLFRVDKFKQAIRYLEIGIKFSPLEMLEAKRKMLRDLILCYFETDDYINSFRLLYKTLIDFHDDSIYEYPIVRMFLLKKISKNFTAEKKNTLLNLEKEFKENNFATNIINSIIKYLLDDFDEMEACLNRAKELAPESLYPSFCLAICYESKKKYREAISLFTEFLNQREIAPASLLLHYQKSSCYYFLILDSWRKGEIDSAKKIIEEGVKYISSIEKDLVNHHLHRKIKKAITQSLIKSYGDKFVLFYEVLLFDYEFQKIFSTNKLMELYQVALLAVMRAVKLPGFYKFLSLRKTREKDLFLFIGFIKFSSVCILLSTLKEKIPTITKVVTWRIDDINRLNKVCGDIFSSCRFEKGKEALEAITNFVFKIKSIPADKIWSVEDELIKLLKPASALNGELSICAAEKDYQRTLLQSPLDQAQRQKIIISDELMAVNIQEIKKDLIKIKDESEKEKEQWWLEVPLLGDIIKLVQKWPRWLSRLKKERGIVVFITALLTSPVVLLSIIVILLKGISSLYASIKDWLQP